MKFDFDARPSDSPFVQAIWRTHSESGGSFISLAEAHWGMIVTQQYGKLTLTLKGPETRAVPAPVPEDAEIFGVVFKYGIFMPQLPARHLVDGQIHLPEARSTSFWLAGSAWEFPNYQNADTFIQLLVRDGLLVRDEIVDAAIKGEIKQSSMRSIQRRFLHVTGLPQRSIHQIERARLALSLLERGVSILDTVEQAGYFDQPHLTRALKHLTGRTPAQIAAQSMRE